MLEDFQVSKQNSCFVKNYIKIKKKRFKLHYDFLKTKQNFQLPQKNFGNGTKRKLLDEIFLVLIENLSFRSRILFPKWIYSFFFRTKAAKQKLSILKERWFDIATSLTLLVLYSRALKVLMYKSGGSIQSQTTHNSENHYFSRFPNCLVFCPLLGVKTLVFLETTVKGLGEKE